MIKKHIENVLTFFDHRVTNAVSEGLNSKNSDDQENGVWISQQSEFSKQPFSFIVAG